MTIGFPQNFIWGTATAAYQVEGAIHEGGRTDSIWDVFCRKEGAIHDHSSGQIACDMYHRYPQDVGIMKELGVDAYRFSISWNRIIPQLGGPVNQEGVDYYHRLLDSLLQAEIRPVATLYHWDLPQYLQDRGGWINRDTALRFADYAQTLAQSLGDRVDTWTTLNEHGALHTWGMEAGNMLLESETMHRPCPLPIISTLLMVWPFKLYDLY